MNFLERRKREVSLLGSTITARMAAAGRARETEKFSADQVSEKYAPRWEIMRLALLPVASASGKDDSDGRSATTCGGRPASKGALHHSNAPCTLLLCRTVNCGRLAFCELCGRGRTRTGRSLTYLGGAACCVFEGLEGGGLVHACAPEEVYGGGA